MCDKKDKELLKDLSSKLKKSTIFKKKYEF